MEGKHTFESKAQNTDQSECIVQPHMDQRAHQSKHNPSDKHSANHAQAHGSRGPQIGPNDVTWWLPRTTDLGAHLLATLPKEVARGGAPGSAKPEVALLASSFHVVVSGDLLKLVLPASTWIPSRAPP
jgi:hypothetical protein